jgi:hypothetical protein
MEISPTKYENDEQYINRIIMIPDYDGALNSFYKIIRSTNKMFCLKKMKAETKFIKTYFDKDENTDTNIYEAKISDKFYNISNTIDRRIRKTNVNKYSVIITSFIQYKV